MCVCFHLLWVYSWLAKNMFQFFCKTFGKAQTHFLADPILRRGITGSCGNSLFNFLRNCQDVFQNSSIILHFHWQHIKVLVSPLLHECLLLSAFLIIYIPSRYDMLFHCGCDLHFLKEISPGCSLEGLMLKLKPVLWPPHGNS